MSLPRTKKRSIKYPVEGTARSATRTWGPTFDNVSELKYDVTSYGKGYSGRQVTTSEGHPWPPGKGIKGDIGGDFTSEKQTAVFNRHNRTLISPVLVTRYDPVSGLPTNFRHTKMVADLYACSPMIAGSNPFPPASPSSENTLVSWGATAVARCKPTNPIADLSVFLGELYREGLPKAVGAQTWEKRTSQLRPKTVAGEYLNVEFGWKPLISEIRSLADAWKRMDAAIAQYERDSGRAVRRRYEFPTEEFTQDFIINASAAPYGAFHSDVLSGCTMGKLVMTRKTVRRRWFSGAFTYYLPYGYDSRIKAHRNALIADQVFGLRLDPEVLWNLAPWSWAVDWFSNVGGVLANISSTLTDGLIMRYGYIMEHTVVEDTYNLVDFQFWTGPYQPPPIVFRSEHKMRRRANPFGFGLTWSSLSLRQQAILTALGIIRVSK